VSATQIAATALVPMRHVSERVPGKNYRMFGDAPLFHHVVRTLLACPEIDEVVIDTDSPTVREQVARHFPQVRLVDRPEHLLGGDVPTNDIIRHDIEQFPDRPLLLQTHSTNPLLETETVSRAIQAFAAARSTHDSLFSVTRLQTRLWNPDGKPLNHDPAVLLRTQDLAPVFEENSCIYVFPRELVLQTGSRVGATPVLFEMDAYEAVDIDEEFDFLVAEALWRLRRQP
jgi:CMP-N-acetylneuraminic acid synthetase